MHAQTYIDSLTVFCRHYNTAVRGSKHANLALLREVASIHTLRVHTKAHALLFFMQTLSSLRGLLHTLQIMQTTGAPRAAIALARMYERVLGAASDGSFCVTKVPPCSQNHPRIRDVIGQMHLWAFARSRTIVCVLHVDDTATRGNFCLKVMLDLFCE